jgi:hypothetical protein
MDMWNQDRQISLPALLDRLRNSKAQRRELARSMEVELTNADWLVLASWDAAASFWEWPGSISIDAAGSITIGQSTSDDNLVVRLTNALHQTRATLIAYEDAPWLITVDDRSAFRLSETIVHRADTLVGCMQYARDSVDQFLYMPYRQRQEQFTMEAQYWHIDRDYFIALLKWWPEAWRLVTGESR